MAQFTITVTFDDTDIGWLEKAQKEIVSAASLWVGGPDSILHDVPLDESFYINVWPWPSKDPGRYKLSVTKDKGQARRKGGRSIPLTLQQLVQLTDGEDRKCVKEGERNE